MKKLPNLFLVGDSTVCDFVDDDYDIPRSGYGSKLKKYFNSEKIIINNLALSGRSSKSFIFESNYQYLNKNMNHGDFLFIDFTHNDEQHDPKRYSNPNYSLIIEGSYKYYLYEYYIKPALNAGTSVILFTPIIRRCNPMGHSPKGNNQFPGGDYVNTVIELSKELNLPLINLTMLSSALYEELGEKITKELHAVKDITTGIIDNTHTNDRGAEEIAQLIHKDIINSKLGLKEYLI